MKLTHKIGDGHTSFPLWNADLSSFPFQLTMINGDAYVIKATQEFEHLLGSKLEKINNVNIEHIYLLFSQLSPFSENQYSTKIRVAKYIPKAEILNGLGIINDSLEATFTFSINDKKISLQLRPNRKNNYRATIDYRNDNTFFMEKKLNQDIWFGTLNNKKVIYFKFHRYTSIANMASLSEDLLSFINRNQSEQLIIDLRDNYGGDFFVGLKLAQFLVLADSINWLSGVYVLINNGTFSAAMSNATQYTQLLNAKLVGEPTGAKPSGYQDMGQIMLPNSGLTVTYSKRLYHFKSDNIDALHPDIPIDITLKDYLLKNDSQLQWILNDIALQ